MNKETTKAEIYATLTKMAEASGLKNTSMFFIDPSTLPEAAKPEAVTEAELFNEALSSLRAMVSGEVRTDPVRLEAIRYQLENADYLSENAKRAD
ncbi:hypothetical protein [Sinorhizobium meliloti]|uniref:hypothetical protein n=1 Tax=Rhizobium meliloti TaxID=382 RepID=UPI003D65AEF1